MWKYTFEIKIKFQLEFTFPFWGLHILSGAVFRLRYFLVDLVWNWEWEVLQNSIHGFSNSACSRLHAIAGDISWKYKLVFVVVLQRITNTCGFLFFFYFFLLFRALSWFKGGWKEGNILSPNLDCGHCQNLPGDDSLLRYGSEQCPVQWNAT